jgi:hypothetical protein
MLSQIKTFAPATMPAGKLLSCEFLPFDGIADYGAQ